MKQKYLFVGRIFSIALVFAMVLAGCEYNGPSVDEISDAVKGKQPTTGGIADTVMERMELSNYSNQMNNLTSFGKLTIGKGIQAWGQTDVAYTLVVNTAERQSFNLPSTTGLTWEGNGTADVKRSDSLITLAEKSNGKTATFNFDIANAVDPLKPVKGVLTITTSYDSDTVGVANINEFFEKVLGYTFIDNYNSVNDIANFALTTNTAITRWGQTAAAAYTITADVYELETARIYSPNSAPVLYNQNNYNWDNASVEWKPPVLGDVTAQMNSGYPSGINYIGGNYLSISNYNGIYYDLSTDSTTAKQAKFEFRITRGEQTISGTVTVNIKKVTKTSAQVEQEQLESLRDTFNNNFNNPNYSSYQGGVVTSFIDKDITAFGQTDVLYTIAARGSNSQYDYNDGDFIYYSYVNLPYVYGYDASDNWVNFLTWTTKTANAAVVLSGTSLKVYMGKTGAAEFSFTYTNPANKTVKGTVKVTVLK
jgi:hypothetical protein